MQDDTQNNDVSMPQGDEMNPEEKKKDAADGDMTEGGGESGM